MKKAIIMLAATAIAFSVNAQQIKLNSPDYTRPESAMKAFQQRQSVRAFDGKDLSTQDLSDLLWAANGFNRPDKRTAATAMNAQEIDVYVCMAGGAYLYDAKNNLLEKISNEDLRPAIGGRQDFVMQAPICLLIVADISRFREDNEAMRRMSAYDAGIVSQNIYLFCSAAGLGTVCRAGMDHAKIKEALGLKEHHLVHLNHPVGYIK